MHNAARMIWKHGAKGRPLFRRKEEVDAGLIPVVVVVVVEVCEM